MIRFCIHLHARRFHHPEVLINYPLLFHFSSVFCSDIQLSFVLIFPESFGVQGVDFSYNLFLDLRRCRGYELVYIDPRR